MGTSEIPANMQPVDNPGCWSAQIFGNQPAVYGGDAQSALHQSSSILHIPKFMKMLSSILNAFPVIGIDATNDTLASALQTYPLIKEKMSQGLMLLAASVAEAIDAKRHPRIKSFSVFTRNVLALEQVRNTIRSKFIVHGKSIDDVWNHAFEHCVYKANGRTAKPAYHPAMLDENGVKFSELMPSNVARSTLYAIQEMHRSGEEITMPEDEWGAFNLSTFVHIKSIYQFGTKIVRSTDDTGESFYSVDNPTGEFTWMQIFECYKTDGKNGKRVGTPSLLRLAATAKLNASNSEGKDSNSLVLADVLFRVNDVTGPMNFAAKELAVSWLEQMKARMFAIMKFKMFNPATHSIVMPVHPQQNMGLDSIRFNARNMTFCGKDELHVHPDYNIMVRGMQHCMDSYESRGYAFVGYPGTGKTILIRQLMMEFPSVPVIQFSISMLTSPEWPTAFKLLGYLVKELSNAGYSKLIFACDDIDSIKDGFEKQAIAPLIQMMDFLRGYKNGSQPVSIIFLATINDPTSLNDAIIKRPGRFDEVIEVPPPSLDALPVIVDRLRKKEDMTDYSSHDFADCMSMIVKNGFTMADIATTMSNIVLYGEAGSDGSYPPSAMESAIERLLTSKKTAGKKF